MTDLSSWFVPQVRPFTLGQLKELLSRTGSLVEEGFWIDKIKSHCFVTVSSNKFIFPLCDKTASYSRRLKVDSHGICLLSIELPQKGRILNDCLPNGKVIY